MVGSRPQRNFSAAGFSRLLENEVDDVKRRNNTYGHNSDASFYDNG